MAARFDLLDRCQDFYAPIQDFLEVGMEIAKEVVGQFEPFVISAAGLDSHFRGHDGFGEFEPAVSLSFPRKRESSPPDDKPLALQKFN